VGDTWAGHNDRQNCEMYLEQYIAVWSELHHYGLVLEGHCYVWQYESFFFFKFIEKSNITEV